jgi:hypothetical protein
MRAIIRSMHFNPGGILSIPGIGIFAFPIPEKNPPDHPGLHRFSWPRESYHELHGRHPAHRVVR